VAAILERRSAKTTGSTSLTTGNGGKDKKLNPKRGSNDNENQIPD